MNKADPLQQLKDIHLPPPVSWWPPAIGWWLLALLVIALLGGLIFWFWRKHRRNRWLRVSWRELERLYSVTESSPAFFGRINALLKRASRLRYPDRGTDSLTGEAWVCFLQNQAPKMPGEDLRRLVESCLHPKPSLSPSQGLKLAGDWLRAQKC